MPTKFTGIIETINDENIGELYHKKIIKLVSGDESIFVEFRSDKALLYTLNLQQGDAVECIFNCVSNLSQKGVRYNNLIGQRIDKI